MTCLPYGPNSVEDLLHVYQHDKFECLPWAQSRLKNSSYSPYMTILKGVFFTYAMLWLTDS